MSNNTKTARKGFFRWIAIGLTFLFIGLKLSVTGPVADWSWVWVLSPLWIYISLNVIVVILAIAFLAAIATMEKVQSKK